MVICEVRRKYWIPRLRSLLRKVQSSCSVCKILRAQPRQQFMGPLPADRLTPYVRPFTYTGLDYFGPVVVTIGRRHEKRWIALFTCLTIRAVHLEVAHDLSTDACIVVIRNFINRRGVPMRLRSDNGTTFIGANNVAVKFKDVFECGRLEDELSSRGVEWLFSSPANPSEGGIWERMVQSVKRVLRHTLKQVAPREHTLQCFIIEAENIVNSRPLTHLPVDPAQSEPLTPNHFLLGSANTARTPGVQDPNPRHLRKQWLISRQLRDAFWKRWIMEYLPTLTRRSKWCQRVKPLAVGDLVLICDVNSPRHHWTRGRIVRLYAGSDGVCRKAEVSTAKGVIRRPASRLAVLDVDGES